jgi:putative ABC transport system permease protein
VNILQIVLKNIKQRKLSAVLTVVSTLLGVALVVAILVIKQESAEAFNQTATGYELIVGPKGSPLQLTLNTIYHIGLPVNNMPYKTYELISKDKRVKLAIPYVMGDNYKNFRLIGTTQNIFTKFEYQKGKKYNFTSGEQFEKENEAVIGNDVAEKTGLKIGDSFTGSHGVEAYEYAEEHDENKFTVTGILQKTFTPNDKVIFIPMESVWDMHYHGNENLNQNFIDTVHSEHDHEEGEVHKHELPPERKTITSVLVTLKNPVYFDLLRRQINDDKFEGINAQAVIPVLEIMQLFEIIGNINSVLLIVAYLVIFVAVISILVSIYNSINERKRDIAIMRALGANKGKIFGIIILEGLFISLVGAVFGVIAGHLAVYIFSPLISAKTGILITGLTFNIFELYLVLGTIILAMLVSILPAVKAYRTDVAKNLTPV